MIVALMVVGVVSHGTLRHIVQTAPLWVVILLGTRRSELSKWAALPCFVFWLLLMIAIWLYLLGLARIVSGTFSTTEIVMTVIVGLAALAGIANAIRMKTGTAPVLAVVFVLLLAALQIGAFWLSLKPGIAHD